MFQQRILWSSVFQMSWLRLNSFWDKSKINCFAQFQLTALFGSPNTATSSSLSSSVGNRKCSTGLLHMFLFSQYSLYVQKPIQLISTSHMTPTDQCTKRNQVHNEVTPSTPISPLHTDPFLFFFFVLNDPLCRVPKMYAIVFISHRLPVP